MQDRSIGRGAGPARGERSEPTSAGAPNVAPEIPEDVPRAPCQPFSEPFAVGAGDEGVAHRAKTVERIAASCPLLAVVMNHGEHAKDRWSSEGAKVRAPEQGGFGFVPDFQPHGRTEMPQQRAAQRACRRAGRGGSGLFVQAAELPRGRMRSEIRPNAGARPDGAFNP